MREYDRNHDTFEAKPYHVGKALKVCINKSQKKNVYGIEGILSSSQ